MILLDHNIPQNQALQLRTWRIHYQQVGYQVGRPEWEDQQEILRLLHRRKLATFFTRDLGFFRRRLCHPNYCIVVVETPALQTASIIRRFLRQPAFSTKVKRRGRVVELSPAGITWWEIGRERRQRIAWIR